MPHLCEASLRGKLVKPEWNRTWSPAVRRGGRPLRSELYEKFQKLSVDTAWIGLAQEEDRLYFCTPIGATIIGWDNGIHYCVIEGFGEMIFTVHPESCCNYYVYPVAEKFSDFLCLVLATKGTNSLQQMILWDRRQYTDFISSPDEMAYASKQEVMDALNAIQAIGISPMEQPFEYVKQIQQQFDYSKIPFSNEYYDVTGREKPE